MDPVKDRVIQGSGTPDSSWLPWLATQAIRPASLNELCPSTARLVVVAPHPDDEVLACGGLLAHRASRGLPSIVIAVTDGEASHGSGDAGLCTRLAARRAQESYSGLRMLGLAPSSVIRLGVPDGNVADRMGSITQRLRPFLRTSDVVVTTWQLDGHPDHEATSDVAKRLCAELGCRLLQAPVWMWHWAQPGDIRIPWGDMLAFDLPETAVSAKQLALGRHLSQLEDRGEGRGPVLVPTITERAARRQEFFFS
jgi:LmbE family N-acetylglucosaminyl deacetylase